MTGIAEQRYVKAHDQHVSSREMLQECTYSGFNKQKSDVRSQRVHRQLSHQAVSGHRTRQQLPSPRITKPSEQHPSTRACQFDRDRAAREQQQQQQQQKFLDDRNSSSRDQDPHLRSRDNESASRHLRQRFAIRDQRPPPRRTASRHQTLRAAPPDEEDLESQIQVHQDASAPSSCSSTSISKPPSLGAPLLPPAAPQIMATASPDPENF